MIDTSLMVESSRFICGVNPKSIEAIAASRKGKPKSKIE
jgi:hypothetical protein